MNIFEVLPPPFGSIVVGGVALSTLALGLVWLADKLVNLAGYDLPDGKYAYYAKFMASALVILILGGYTFEVPMLDPAGTFFQLLVAVLTALGYDFGSKARAQARK